MRYLLSLACILLALSTARKPAEAAGVVADLSHHLIAITTAFSGTEVLLFGALEEPGTDVAIVVRGPPSDTVVRHKTRVGPIWLNTEQMTFSQVPSYYAVAASRPLDQMADIHELRRHGIGVENLGLEKLAKGDHNPGQIESFAQALVRNKRDADLYSTGVAEIRFVGQKLFRTTLAFPANVPPGQYEVQVYEIRDQAVVGAQHNALLVSKVGVEADIYDSAHRSPALYGLASIILAVCAGWTASIIFKK